MAKILFSIAVVAEVPLEGGRGSKMMALFGWAAGRWCVGNCCRKAGTNAPRASEGTNMHASRVSAFGALDQSTGFGINGGSDLSRSM
ncbi:hypothetical protein KSP40_PGU005535 [Platanthera guangdongensis]|uniref:Secreted protein n=1 Tax=Platanthera guangdongensis TaxID=2320717 RepID=A0ABR2M4R6_9ASPA